jgi:tetratricopeptide (TPR) repeat protein
MVKRDTLSEWDLVKQGQYELAYLRLTERIAKEPEREGYHTNRGLCLLNMGRLEEALADFQIVVKLRSESASESARAYIDVGVTLWWLGEPLEATAMWRNAIEAKYTDEAGGIEAPALLFFAASRLADQELEKEAEMLLRKKWKPQLAQLWPGPIAGFLLGKMDEETFLVKQTFQNQGLEARRLCKAHFWTGLVYFRQGDVHRYLHHLQQSLVEGILEPEYYLAKCEMEALSQRS